MDISIRGVSVLDEGHSATFGPYPGRHSQVVSPTPQQYLISPYVLHEQANYVTITGHYYSNVTRTYVDIHT